MKKILLSIFGVMLLSVASKAQVAINIDASLPDNSAMLDVKPTVKGILIPRMTAIQRNAISSPATGLLVFCTDNNHLFINRGTLSSPDWTIVNGPWQTIGADIYYNSGNVGIGTLTPSAKLDVRGNNPDDGAVFQIGNSDLSHRMILFGGRENDPSPFIHWKQGDPLRFTTDEGGWSEKMRITSNGQLSIGTTTPDNSAIADFTSTTKGFLPPRMTTTQRNAITATAGLTIYNITKNCFECYNGTAWYSTVHYIGENYCGGIVFFVYDNGQHGLIAATADQSSGIRWDAGTYTNTMAYADGVGAGKPNTVIIIANQGYGDGVPYAARICNEYSVMVSGVTYGDWYLPSKFELNLLYLQKSVVGGFDFASYWSSTEGNSNDAWGRYFGSGLQGDYEKNSEVSVRAIRAF